MIHSRRHLAVYLGGGGRANRPWEYVTEAPSLTDHGRKVLLLLEIVVKCPQMMIQQCLLNPLVLEIREKSLLLSLC